MSVLDQLLDPVRLGFGRLNQREQTAVITGSAVGLLVVMGVVGLALASEISTRERRVESKTEQLMQVLALEGDYSARRAAQTERLATLGRSNVRLVSLVEDAAKRAGVNIGQLRPEDGEPNDEGISESRVDLKAADLSADRLQKFLNLLAEAPGIVIVRRLRVNKPYRKDTGEIELTVTTYKLKASPKE